MKILVLSLLLVLAFLFLATRYLAWRVEAENPASGLFAEIDGVKLHYTDWEAGAGSELLPMVFIHGASGNLQDLEAALAHHLRGRGRMIFVDRPGHGYSERGNGDDIHLPWGQARLISGLLKKLGIEKAVVIGHSYGGSVAAAFAVNHPHQTTGLMFLAPATHPWPGGGVTWYYDVTNTPVAGFLFSETLAVPAGHLRFEQGVKGVFDPQQPPENYTEKTANKLLLRPSTFRNNAKDVGSLFEAVSEIAPRYSEISVPASIITGDSDDVVLANIHSVGLDRDIKGSKLVWLEGVGHSPAWSNPEIVISEIEGINKAVKSGN